MKQITISVPLLTLSVAAVFLSGFITCFTTPLVDKYSFFMALEKRSVSYLTSNQLKMETSAAAAAVEACSPEISLTGDNNRPDTYFSCMAGHYREYATRFSKTYAMYQFTACDDAQLSPEKTCLDLLKKAVSGHSTRAVPPSTLPNNKP